MQTILIAGPTASGKSRLAIELARRVGGVVINADSMQVYAELRVLSARPTADEVAPPPHRLYGHVPAATRYSVGRWLGDAARGAGRGPGRAGWLPIFVGGTGLYFRALTEGLATIPPVPADLRDAAGARNAGRRQAKRCMRGSPPAIPRPPRRSARPTGRGSCRALEVFEATGRPLADWQRGAGRAAAG